MQLTDATAVVLVINAIALVFGAGTVMQRLKNVENGKKCDGKAIMPAECRTFMSTTSGKLGELSGKVDTLINLYRKDED